MDLKKKLRHVIDFPKPGIDFIDITTVLQEPEYLRECLDMMHKEIMKAGDFDLIAGPESRGFIFGVPLAYIMGKGFIPIRKAGKLPYQTVAVEYEKEYGTDIFEIHSDAVKPGQRIVIVDDLLATGGTTEANIRLIEKLGGIVTGVFFFIELGYLEGRKRLEGYNVRSLVRF